MLTSTISNHQNLHRDYLNLAGNFCMQIEYKQQFKG